MPRHWCFKRKYLQGKRGIEKPPFDLPDFIKVSQSIVNYDSIIFYSQGSPQDFIKACVVGNMQVEYVGLVASFLGTWELFLCL